MGDILSSIRDQGIAEVEHKSCIRLDLSADDSPPTSDWLFFLSPSGVELFAERFSTKGFKVGVIWEGTAEAVREHLDVMPDFVATHVDSGEAVAEFIAQLSSNETVTVAQGDLSLRRFAGKIAADRLREWTFYSNEPNAPDQASDADYLLFTSPSNAEAYLDSHGIKEDQKIVSIGRTTLAKLHGMGYADALLSEEPSEKGMWEAVVRDLEKLKSKY